MKSIIKIGLAAIVLLVGINALRPVWEKAKVDLVSPDGKSSVIDGMIGKTAVDRYLEIKDKKDTFNLPAFKTGLVMFYTQHGRYPKDMQELEGAGDLSTDFTRDRFGNPFDLKVLNQKHIILHSVGKDRIRNTTDDLEYRISM